MNSATCVTNEEPGSIPPTLIVKFLLYSGTCSSERRSALVNLLLPQLP